MSQLDVREALTDAFLWKGGVLNRSQCHPLLSSIEGGTLAEAHGTLRKLAETFGNARSNQPNSVFASGLSSSDFANHLGETLRRPVLEKLQAQTSHRAFCQSIEVPNFKIHEFPSIGIDAELLEATPELAEHANVIGVVDLPGLNARIFSYGRNLSISREVIINDAIGTIISAFSGTGVSAGRLEARLVYALLESNPTLADGGAMFHSNYGNLLSGAALSLDSIGESMSALRKVKTDAGNEADTKAAFLIVPAEQEALARSINHNNDLGLTVIATTQLTANWYVAANPMQAPVIGLLKLDSSVEGIVVGNVKAQDDLFDGVKLGVRYDVGVAALGRLGAVRRPLA